LSIVQKPYDPGQILGSRPVIMCCFQVLWTNISTPNKIIYLTGVFVITARVSSTLTSSSVETTSRCSTVTLFRLLIHRLQCLPVTSAAERYKLRVVYTWSDVTSHPRVDTMQLSNKSQGKMWPRNV
jgi:hypothetical protein